MIYVCSLGVCFHEVTNKLREDSYGWHIFFFLVFLGLPVGLTHCAIV